MGRLQNQAIAITGASSGVGAAAARLFAAEGASLSLLARRPEPLRGLAQSLPGAPLAQTGDVGQTEDVKSWAKETARRMGKIHGLFLNAGMAPFYPLAEVTEERFSECVRTNVWSAFLCLQSFLPHLADDASILLTGSGLHHRPVPEASVWAASTWALRGLAAALAVELAGHGVRVNVLSHGPVETPIYEGYGLPPEALDGLKSQLAQKTLVGRLAQPGEIAEVALLFFSGRSRFVTGAEWVCDGGWALAGGPSNAEST